MCQRDLILFPCDGEIPERCPQFRPYDGLRVHGANPERAAQHFDQRCVTRVVRERLATSLKPPNSLRKRVAHLDLQPRLTDPGSPTMHTTCPRP